MHRLAKGPHKIAFFLATSGHSGVDRAMQNLIPAIIRRGYPVDLLHVRKHGPNIKESHPGLNIIDLGAKHVYSSFAALLKYLKTKKPYVMLTDKDRVNRTAIFARAMAHVSTRLVLSSGTTISIDLATRGVFERWLQRTSMGKLYPLADNVIVTSKGVADDMAEYTGLSRKLIEVVPSPVVHKDLFIKELPVPDHRWYKDISIPIILGVGELCMRKDFETLLRAFAKIRSQRQCRLIILGKGNKRDELYAIAKDLNVRNDFDMPGFVSSPYSYMAHASVLGFTSRWEGLGFVIIEALATGTPAVTTDCPSGPREILDNGKYGSLVPVGDVDKFADALLETLDNPLPKRHLQNAALPYEIENSTSAYLRAMNLTEYPE